MGANRAVPAAAAAGIAIAIVAAFASDISGVPMGVLTRDIHSLSASGGLDLPRYAGSLSMLTIMVWTAGGSLALAAAAIVPTRPRWLLVLGGLLFVTAADDAFMLHEGLGLPEIAFVVLYGAVAGWLAFHSIVHLRDGSAIAILVGGAALALSAVLDLWVTDPYLFEDHFKLIGALVLATVGPTTIASVRGGRGAEAAAEAEESRLTLSA